MTAASTPRPPRADEYQPYYGAYVSLVPPGDVVATLRGQLSSFVRFFEGVPAAKHDFRYAPGKWTAKEVLGHVIDAEWIFTYRALSFARGDAAALPGMDQDVFMAGANFAQRDWAGMVDELRHLRSANLALFGSFDESILDRTGVASGCRFTVRALVHVIAGHGLHHVNVLKERYL